MSIEDPATIRRNFTFYEVSSQKYRDVVGRAVVHSKESFLASPKYICLFMV